MLCVLCPLPLNSSPMCCSNETGGVSITAKNAISFSPVSSWLLLISVLPIIYPAHRLHLISYSHRPLILLEMSPVDRDPRSILRRDILTLLMVSRRSTKIFPPFYSNESACGEGHCADQCTNLNNLSPAARVSNTVSWRDYTVSSFFFRPAKPVGRMVKIDHYFRVGGRNLSAPPSAYMLLASAGTNQMVGTQAVSFES